MKSLGPKTPRRKRQIAKRAYDASGRRAEAERTAARIVAAATDLVKEGVLPKDLSYADVGVRAGVAARTVYRHFPETADLLSAVALSTLGTLTEGKLAVDRPGVARQLATTQRALSADPSLFHVFVATPLRSGMDYGNHIKTIFADVLQRVPAKYQDATAAVLEILGNPYAWQVMHEYWGLPPERITRACLAAAQAVADRFQREPELLDPSAPLPPLFRPEEPNRANEGRKKGKGDES